jgi:hypothetical protein
VHITEYFEECRNAIMYDSYRQTLIPGAFSLRERMVVEDTLNAFANYDLVNRESLSEQFAWREASRIHWRHYSFR